MPMKTPTHTRSQPRMWRSRWAAIGAAAAVTLGAGGLWAAEAASPPSVFVAISPTRILDTRINAGLAGPLINATPRMLAVTGTVPVVQPGDNITTGAPVPAGATAIVANVTAVFPTTAGFIAVRPGTATGTPATSNINFTTGGVIAPNSVTVELPTTGASSGKIQLWFTGTAPNATTHLLVDVVGYYRQGPAGPQGEPGPVGPTGATGTRGPAGATGATGVGFRTDCADLSMSAWNATTSTWDCKQTLYARGTGPTEYGARIYSDAYRGMYVQGRVNFFDAYFGGDTGISTYALTSRSGAARSLAVNLGSTTIESGDLVAVVGVTESADGQPMLGVARVDAANADAVVGVAERAMSADPSDNDGSIVVPSTGSIEAGGYVVVVTSGLALAVNVDGLTVAADTPVGATLELYADGTMRTSGGSSTTVEIGRVVGPIDEANGTVPMFIDIN